MPTPPPSMQQCSLDDVQQRSRLRTLASRVHDTYPSSFPHSRICLAVLTVFFPPLQLNSLINSRITVFVCVFSCTNKLSLAFFFFFFYITIRAENGMEKGSKRAADVVEVLS